MPSRTPRLTTFALATLASLVLHQLAYLLVRPLSIGGGPAVDHGHLAAQWALVTPLGAMAATVFVLRHVRRLGLAPRLTTGTLLGPVWTLFVVQEAAEFTLSGHAPWEALTSAPVVLGLLIAPLVAWGFARMLRAVEDLVLRHRASRTDFWSGDPVLAVSRSTDVAPALHHLLTAPTRGPPVFV